MAETIFTPPTRMDVREATPSGRAPYIAARKAIDHFLISTAAGVYDVTPKIRVAFAMLSEGMHANTLEPPIEASSDLGGLIDDFNRAFNSTNGRRPDDVDPAVAVDALYLVEDHGSRPAVLEQDGV